MGSLLLNIHSMQRRNLAMLSISISLTLIPLCLVSSPLHAAPSPVISHENLSIQPLTTSPSTDNSARISKNTRIDSLANIWDLEYDLGLPTFASSPGTLPRPPLCNGSYFGKGLKSQSCDDAFQKMRHTSTEKTFAWPGYGQIPDVFLPRRFSSCK